MGYNVDVFEVSAGGWGFYICYGEHGHGYFIAIPNFGICVEAAEYDNVFYNAENLRTCKDENVAQYADEIARGIMNYFNEEE